MGGRPSFNGYYFILDQFSQPIDFSRLLSQIVVVLILQRFSFLHLRNQIRTPPKRLAGSHADL
jgi:hypothetical protein